MAFTDPTSVGAEGPLSRILERGCIQRWSTGLEGWQPPAPTVKCLLTCPYPHISTTLGLLHLAKYKLTLGGQCKHSQSLAFSLLIGLFKSNSCYCSRLLPYLCYGKCPFSVGWQIPFWADSITSQERLTIEVQSRV